MTPFLTVNGNDKGNLKKHKTCGNAMHRTTRKRERIDETGKCSVDVKCNDAHNDLRNKQLISFRM